MSYRRDDIVDRGRRPVSNSHGSYRISPFTKMRDSRSERSGYRDSYERSSRPSSRNERGYQSRTYSPVARDSRERYSTGHERERRSRRSNSAPREEWNNRYSSREVETSRNVRGHSREREYDYRKESPPRDWSRSPHGHPREYMRSSHRSRSPRRSRRPSPEPMIPVREERRERNSPYCYKSRERGKSQPPSLGRHRPSPRSVPSLMDKDLTGSNDIRRDWRNSSSRQGDTRTPVDPRRPRDPRKRPSQGLLPTPEEHPSALFAELVYTGAKIVSANLNGSITPVPSNGPTGKRTLLPTPLPPEDLRNRLGQKTLLTRSVSTSHLQEPNGGLNRGISSCSLVEVAPPNSEKSAYQHNSITNGTGYGENSTDDAELLLLYQSEGRAVPTLIPIIKQEVEAPPEILSEYDGISKQFLFCHLCIKHLADGMSFESHLTDPAHVSLVESFELNYKLQLDVLRHNAKLEKQRRDLELERPGTEPLKKCTICDVHFDGSVLVHRKSTHHQRLKRFLNPSCRVCRLEFGSRIERDYHRLSADHLKALQNQERSLAYANDDREVDGLETIESLDITVPSGPQQCHSPNHVADEESVGESAIHKVAAFYCRVCYKHLLTRSEAYDVHCKTKGHHERYQTWLDNPPAIEAA